MEQFIRLYNKLKVIVYTINALQCCSVDVFIFMQNDSGRGLKWGGELEYIIVKLDHKQKKARVSLRAR